MKSEEMRKYLILNNCFTAAPVLLFALTVAFSSLGFLLGGHTVVVSLLIAAAVSVVMLLNSAVGFVGVPTYFYMTTVGLEEKMTEIRESGQRVLLNINDFPCHAIWFDEHDIDYELIYDGEGIEWQDFYETTRYCFD